MASDLLALLDTLDGLMVAMTPGPYCRAHHGAWELQARPNQRLADFGTIDHAADDAQAVQALLNAYPRLAQALRTALTPTTDGEREAREALARYDSDPYHGDPQEQDIDVDHLRTALALLAAERAKAADAAREREAWVCNCGLPMSRNPHPDAGKPAALLDVGAVWVCIPCTVKSRHGATTARFQAERDRDGERAAIVAWLRGPCNDPVHDDRWCPTCEARSDYADAIERGAHTKVTP